MPCVRQKTVSTLKVTFISEKSIVNCQWKGHLRGKQTPASLFTTNVHFSHLCKPSFCMKKSVLFLLLLPLIFASSCVSKKKYLEANKERLELRGNAERTQTALDDCNRQRATLQTGIDDSRRALEAERTRAAQLQQQLEDMRNTNTNLLDRMADLSVISKTGAESIKKSLESINEQGRYIKDLNSASQRKDSLNLALVVNLKRSLADINDQDVTIEVKKGVVYISISDKMLFKSGSADISPQAEVVLGKIAQVVTTTAI